jgi:hypothetical protein
MDEVIVKMNIDQARSVMAALEFYARMHMGQFDSLDWQFVTHSRTRNFWRDQRSRDDARLYAEQLRRTIFPELEKNASYGIASPEIPDSARDAWDLYQSLRHNIAWYVKPNPDQLERWTTSYDVPFKQSTKHDLPVVTVHRTVATTRDVEQRFSKLDV